MGTEHIFQYVSGGIALAGLALIGFVFVDILNAMRGNVAGIRWVAFYLTMAVVDALCMLLVARIPPLMSLLLVGVGVILCKQRRRLEYDVTDEAHRRIIRNRTKNPHPA